MARLLAAVAVLLVSVPAVAEPDPPLPAEARACVAELTRARADVNRRRVGRLAGTIDAFPPVDRPARRTSPRVKPMPAFKRHGWSAHFELQRHDLPEYYYVDVLDLRDDRGAWASVPTDDTWACRETQSDDQRNAQCVLVRGDRVAVVRATHWRRRTPARIAAYLEAFRAATERCLASP